jgi:5'-3' exonuclease
MGVQDFFGLVEGTPISLSELSGSRIAVDGYTEIYRAGCSSLALKFTDKEGNPTGHIKFLLSKLVMLRKNNIELVFVMDGKPPIEKEAELKKRADMYAAKSASNKQFFKVTRKVREDVELLLKLLGVNVVQTPDGYDAEHICALMNKRGEVDHVLTTDADAFAYGAISVVRGMKGGKYELYERQQYIDLFNGDHIIEASVALGSDFCKKIRGIGPKTLLKRINNLKFEDCHEVAMSVFRRDVEYNVIHNEGDHDELRSHLSNLGFNMDKLKIV